MSPPRLHVEAPLAAGFQVALERGQSHYLRHVLRLGAGAAVRLFNGRDGEWAGALAPIGRGDAAVEIGERTRPPEPAGGPWLLFAPVKRQRIDLIAEKATELGAARLIPVMTRHVAVERVNVDRLRAIAVEAAEQCERLTVPTVDAPRPLLDALAGWPAGRTLYVADERGAAPPIADAAVSGAFALLIGPEGGFAPAELDAVRELAFSRPVALGARILRADTAAIAGLAILQAVVGDWRGSSEPTGPYP